MRVSNDQVVTSQAMSGTGVINSDPIYLGHMAGVCIQAKWTGTPTGTFKLQCAVTKGENSANTPAVMPTDWQDIADSSYATGGAAGTYTWNVRDAFYNWIRVVYTNASGTGTLESVIFNAKGV